MQRDAQGHVAEPCGPARVLAWHGYDMCIFIFTRISMVIVHISIRYSNYANPLISRILYTQQVLLILCVGLCSRHFVNCTTRGAMWNVKSIAR